MNLNDNNENEEAALRRAYRDFFHVVLEDTPQPTLITMTQTAPSLETAQRLVGGLVEIIEIHKGGEDAQLLVNEEGRIKKLDANINVSRVCKGIVVFGNAVLLKGKAMWT